MSHNGSLPAWLEGDLVRNGPGGGFDLPKRRPAHYFDGFARAFRWRVGNGSVWFQDRYVGGNVYGNATSGAGAGSFPRTVTFGPLEPPPSIFDKGVGNDNMNVNVWQMPRGDGTILALTDAGDTVDLDAASLAYRGLTRYSSSAETGTAHPLRDLRTGEFVNVMGVINGSAMQVNVSPFRLAAASKGGGGGSGGAPVRQREPFGRVVWSMADYSYMHSFARSAGHVSVFGYPLGFDLMLIPLKVAPIVDMFKWLGPRNDTWVHVFASPSHSGASLSGGGVPEPDAPPVATWVGLPPCFTWHHVNSFDSSALVHASPPIADAVAVAGAGAGAGGAAGGAPPTEVPAVTVDAVAYDIGPAEITGNSSFGYMVNNQNTSKYASFKGFGRLRRFTLPLKTRGDGSLGSSSPTPPNTGDARKAGSGASVVDLPVVDANGTSYRIEFPKMNPAWEGARYCHMWATSAYAYGPSFSDVAVLHVDVCKAAALHAAGWREGDAAPAPKAASVVAAWWQSRHYPSEAVFVPRTAGREGTAEDDGVLLSSVLDARADTSYLLVLNASTLATVATSYAPYRQPLSFHGDFLAGTE